MGGVGPGAGNDARVYFVSLIPRREFLSEEEMATTTLAAAGLVPNGTLMVRQQLVAPPDAGPSGGWLGGVAQRAGPRVAIGAGAVAVLAVHVGDVHRQRA